MIRENDARAECVRAKLAHLGGELKPLRRPRKASAAIADDIWGVRSLARMLRIDVKSAKNEPDEKAARDVARLLMSCGFHARTISEIGGDWSGIHIESQSGQAAVALIIQGAFHTAGLGAGLTIHDRAAAHRITVHVGTGALE